MARYIAQEQIQPGPIASNAPLWEEVSNTFKGIAEATAPAAGAEAGLQKNFTPLPPLTRAAAAYNEAGLKIHSALLSSDIQKHMFDLTNQISQNIHGQDSVAEFNKAYKTYSDHVLQETPPQTLPYIKNVLLNEGQRGYQKIQGLVLRQQNAVATEDAYGYVGQQLTTISNTAFDGDRNTALSQAGALGRHLDGLVAAGNFNARQAGLLKQKMFQNLYENYTLGRFQNYLDNPNNKSDDYQKYINDFRKNNPYKKYLSPEDVDAISSKMQGMMKSKLRQIFPTAQDVNSTMEDLVWKAQTGQSLDNDQGKLNSLQAYLPATTWNRFQGQLSQAREAYGTFTANKFDPIGQMQAKIADLQSVAGKTREQWESDQQVAKLLTNQLQAIKHNPAEVVETDPAYKTIYNKLKLKTITADPNQDPKNYAVQVAQFNRRIAQKKIQMQEQLGVNSNNTTLLNDFQLNQLATSITTAPTLDQGVQIMEQQQDKYGPQYGILLRQLMNKNGSHLPAFYSLLAGAQKFPEMSPYLQQAKTAFSVGGRKLVKSLIDPKDASDIQNYVSSDLSEWSESTYGVNSDSAGYTAQYLDAVTQYAKYLRVAAGISSNQDAAQLAANRLILCRYAPNGVNQYYRVPRFDNKGNLIDARTVQVLMQVSDKAIGAKLNKIYEANQSIMNYQNISNFRDSVQQGHWRNLPLDQGWVRVTKDGIPINDEDGKPIEIKLDEINQPTSQTLAITHGLSPTVFAQEYNSYRPLPDLGLRAGDMAIKQLTSYLNKTSPGAAEKGVSSSFLRNLTPTQLLLL